MTHRERFSQYSCKGLLSCGLLIAAVGSAQTTDIDLTNISLEQLTQMRISVSSFARKDEDLWKTPAAVFVITQDDIARSSMSSIPELLRMVPGMEVAQLDASTWAISARGFNNVYAGKLLVLVDGRTVYSEIYSGAHWDQIDIPLEDIERIEVVRGPGAATWGTNAVNGVVNIITKTARRSAGLSASNRLSRISEAAHIRYGGRIGHGAEYRAFLGYTERQPFDLVTGREAFDGEDILRGGGRMDWQKSASDSITTNGDVYGGRVKQRVLPVVDLSVGPDGQDSGSIAGGYLLSRWEHKSQGADTALQIYYDDQSRHELGSNVRIRTTDLDFQDHFPLRGRNDIVWGAEYRFTADHLAGQVLPTTRSEYRNYLVDAFLEDEIAIVPERLIATLGSKIQQGTLAGFQAQPSARLLWSPTRIQSLWVAVSRAAVAPSIEDKYLVVPLNLGSEHGLPLRGETTGNPAFKPEDVLAYEAGYRVRFGSALTIDIASFVNRNRLLQSTLMGAPMLKAGPPPEIVIPFLFVNGFQAKTAGVESSLSWKPVSTFSFIGNYVWMQDQVKQTWPGAVASIDPWNAPRSSMCASASWDFARHWSVSSFLSHVGVLQSTTTASGIPAYTRSDIHIGRKVGESLQFDVGGTNLLTARHPEFSASTGFDESTYVPRSVFIKAIWSF